MGDNERTLSDSDRITITTLTAMHRLIPMLIHIVEEHGYVTILNNIWRGMASLLNELANTDGKPNEERIIEITKKVTIEIETWGTNIRGKDDGRD